MFSKFAFLVLIFISIVATSVSAKEISPQEPGDAIGYFCNMTIAAHKGAKAQLFLKKNESKPLWFSTIRDLFIYIKSPEEDQRISAIYVNDMGAANWDNPETGTWTDAYKAHYVIDSKRLNGMGGTSIVPFADRTRAQEFIKNYGGTIKGFNDIPESYILDTENAENADTMKDMDHMSSPH